MVRVRVGVVMVSGGAVIMLMAVVVRVAVRVIMIVVVAVIVMMMDVIMRMIMSIIMMRGAGPDAFDMTTCPPCAVGARSRSSGRGPGSPASGHTDESSAATRARAGPRRGPDDGRTAGSRAGV